MNQEKVGQAISHGIKLLSGEVEGTQIPYDDNVYVLKQFLIALASGQLAVSQAVHKEPEKKPPQDGTPSPQKRAANRKKRAKKTSTKK